MRHGFMSTRLLALALFLALASTALARDRWYVDGVNGNDGNHCRSHKHACKTIGQAISFASTGDSIVVAAATYPENLTIGFSLRIMGSGALTTIIDGGFANTVVTIPNANVHVTLSKLTITNGFSPIGVGGGGIHNNGGRLVINDSTISRNWTNSCCPGGDGGGIYNNGGRLVINNSTISGNFAVPNGDGGGIMNLNNGVLTIRNSTLSGNVAGIGGAICNDGALTISNSTFSGNGGEDAGGAICNGGVLTISNSTFTGNDVESAFGGGIFNLGTATIADSTFSDNDVLGFGGGIYTRGKLTISNSTISGNSAGRAGGGIFAMDATVTISNVTLSGNRLTSGESIEGGNIYGGGAVTIQNSIVANGVVGRDGAGGNCFGTFTSKGYNLSSDSTCNFNSAGDLNNTDPQLGPLQDNGGATQTMALPSGSAAVDAGNPSGCTNGDGDLLKTDQRGMPRPDKEDKGGCDMGAYERQSD